MINSAFPILTTRHLPRMLEFYEAALGGRVVYRFPADGPPQYVSIQLGESSIGLGEDRQSVNGGPQRISLWMYVDDCDEALEVMSRSGADVLEEPADQPWGERIARVADPDGNEIIVGSSSG